jgi:hypothetical protein
LEGNLHTQGVFSQAAVRKFPHPTEWAKSEEEEAKIMSKPLVLIENWSVVRRGAYVDFQELHPGNVLTGRVFGHSRVTDHKSIFTSPIVSVRPDEGRVETRNTVYQLGQASEEYRNWDNARRSVAA